MKVIGISCNYHDSAVAMIDNGTLVAAAQEERFTRIKNDPSFPIKALTWLLTSTNTSMSEVACFSYYENPAEKFDRILNGYALASPTPFADFSAALKSQLRKIDVEKILREKLGFENRFFQSQHHMSHAASAFYASPFKSSAILTIDGVGEWDTTTVGVGDEQGVHISRRIRFPNSIGLLYSAFTHYCGFKVNSGEYKLMGLAPYGEPRYADLIREELIDIKEDGSYRLNQEYFGLFCQGAYLEEKFEKLFDNPKRVPETLLKQFDMDIAASIQQVTDGVVTNLARFAQNETQEKNLSMAGGVALNAVSNGKLLEERIFDRVWIQPAAGDAGGAIGAAFDFYYTVREDEAKGRKPVRMSPFLGPSYSDAEIKRVLDELGADYTFVSQIAPKTAELLAKGNVVGWFQGSMEFGPRALGNRSILADPRSKKMQKDLNLKIKYREGFRPFAPSVLAEESGEWFEMEEPSPYMLFVTSLNVERRRTIPENERGTKGIESLRLQRSEVPAVTHVDYTARIQTVDESFNERFYDLIRAFFQRTGCPMVVNTSFNVRGEPIVMSPTDAFRCFMATEMDALVLGNYLLLKADQRAPKNLNPIILNLD